MPPGGNQHLGLLIRSGGHPGLCESKGPGAAMVPPVHSTTLIAFALGPLQPNPVTKKFPGVLREFPVVNAGEKIFQSVLFGVLAINNLQKEKMKDRYRQIGAPSHWIARNTVVKSVMLVKGRERPWIWYGVCSFFFFFLLFFPSPYEKL